MLKNDFLDDREAEARAAGFCGEKRQEKFAHGFAVNSRAVVKNGDALVAGAVALKIFASNDDFSAIRSGAASFGGVAREIEKCLAQKTLVAGDFTEGTLLPQAHKRHRFGNFSDDTLNERFERDLFVGNVERAGVLQKFRDNAGDVLCLLKDFFGTLSGFRIRSFELDHLGIAGNRGESIFEFVCDSS